MGKVFYNQADNRWASHPYPSMSYPNATIKSGGCGPTAAAMVISSFKETILPNQMGDIFRQNGYRAASGTAGSSFPFIAKKWGLTCNVKVKLDDAIACLNRGGMVVVNVKGGSVFSTGGHYVVLAYMKDSNTIAVFDPYMYTNKFNKSSRRNKVTVDGNTVYISYSNMKNYGKYSNLYCFEAPEQTKPISAISKYSAGQSVVVKVRVADTGSRQGDKIQIENTNMPDADKKQFWIHKSVLKENNSVLHALGVLAYAEGNKYIMQVFDDLFWVMGENLSLPENSNTETVEKANSTVGKIRKFKATNFIYSNSNLSGNKYTYKSNTSVKILQNVSATVDKVQVIQTGRCGYVKNNLYK